MSGAIVHDGDEYVPTVGEEEYGWCWCTDGQHFYHTHPSMGFGPAWCGSRVGAGQYRAAVMGPRERKGSHMIRRRLLVSYAQTEEVSS